MGALSEWKIEYEGMTFEPPLSGAQVVLIAEYAGVEDWSMMSPLTSPKVLAAYLAVLVAERTGRDDVDAVAGEILRRPITELLDCCSVRGD